MGGSLHISLKYEVVQHLFGLSGCFFQASFHLGKIGFKLLYLSDLNTSAKFIQTCCICHFNNIFFSKFCNVNLVLMKFYLNFVRSAENEDERRNLFIMIRKEI